MQKFKKPLSKQQEVFHCYKDDTELVTKLRFKISEATGEKGKPYSDDEFITNCLELFIENVFSEKKYLANRHVSFFSGSANRRSFEKVLKFLKGKDK